jgi:hypothetical protein
MCRSEDIDGTLAQKLLLAVQYITLSALPPILSKLKKQGPWKPTVSHRASMDEAMEPAGIGLQQLLFPMQAATPNCRASEFTIPDRRSSQVSPHPSTCSPFLSLYSPSLTHLTSPLRWDASSDSSHTSNQRPSCSDSGSAA